MRNEWAGLAVAVLISASAARADDSLGSWFPPSPCEADAPMVTMPGGEVFFSVHDRPGAPPHDARLRYGADGHLRVPLAEWSRWTPRPPPSVESGSSGAEVPLAAGDGLALRVDGCTAELWVDADPERRQSLRLDGERESAPLSRAGLGGFLNIDAEYGGLLGRHGATGLFDLGAFAPAGAGRSAWFATQDEVRRLDTSLLHDWPQDAVRLRLGDSITHSPDWESPVRFGGVQWGRDFSLQPDRVTFPLPSLAGSAALASTAQLYVNGQPLSQQALQPGQFRFESVPVLTGAGELSVVIRDALGQQHTVTQPFYASPRLLAAGLSAYTLEGGFLREGYATAVDRYTIPFAAAIGQRGLDDRLTGLLRLVGGQRRQQGGAEADWIVDRLGVLTVSAAAAHSEAGWGGIATLAFERVAAPFSLSLRRRFATSAYAELGRDPGMLHFSDAARLSYDARRGGVGSVVYVSEQPWAGSGTRLAGLAYNIQALRSVQFYASWLHSLGGAGPHGDSIAVGLTVNFGQRNTAGTQWNRDASHGGASAYVQHSAPGPLGWSYFGSGDFRDGGVRQAEAAWSTERGRLGAGWAQFAGHGAPSASAQTALALLDGHAYWTRPIQSSFAVVEAGEAPGARVYRENQLVGSTGAGGRLLVPDLLPYQPNRISVDDRDLPLGLGLSSSELTVTAPVGAGVPLHFEVDRHSSLRLHLVDEDGHSIPVGTPLSIDGVVQDLPVGFDGLVYAALAEGSHRLRAEGHGWACEARLQIGDSGVRLGPCRKELQ